MTTSLCSAILYFTVDNDRERRRRNPWGRLYIHAQKARSCLICYAMTAPFSAVIASEGKKMQVRTEAKQISNNRKRKEIIERNVFQKSHFRSVAVVAQALFSARHLEGGRTLEHPIYLPFPRSKFPSPNAFSQPLTEVSASFCTRICQIMKEKEKVHLQPLTPSV